MGRRDSDHAQADEGLVLSYLSVETVFGIQSSAEKMIELLGDLSRDEVLFGCAMLNRTVNGPGEGDRSARQMRALQQIATNTILQDLNGRFAGQALASLPAFFFRGQLLELVRWAVRFCPNTTPNYRRFFEDSSWRTRFFRVALIASDLWGRRVYGDRTAGPELDEDRKAVLGAFRQGHEDSVAAPDLLWTLARGLALFTEQFPAHYPNFQAEFQAAAGLTVEQYFACLTGLMSRTASDSRDWPLFDPATYGQNAAYKEAFARFLMGEAIDPEELAVRLWERFDKEGFRALRERPIIRLAGGLGVILDPALFSEKISVGPLFYLVAQANKDGRDPHRAFGAFGDAFEAYVNDILESMYPTGKGLAVRLKTLVKGVGRTGDDFEIDAVQNDVIHVVLFEHKAVWLRDDMVLGDVEAWIKQLRRKYGAVPEEGDKHGVGVAQLAGHVRRIVDRNCGAVQGDFDRVKLIRPVLLVHDTRLSAPLYGTFFDREFRRLLGDVPSTMRVMPLAIMTIEDLEILQGSVENFSMQDFLQHYAEVHPEGISSLHHFIATDSRYRHRLKQSDQLAGRAMRLIEIARRELFPNGMGGGAAE